MICDWIKKDETRCNKSAKEGFSLCNTHLEEQKKIADLSLKNSKHFTTEEKENTAGQTKIESSGLNQLEAATEEAGEGALKIWNKDPKKFYKWVRDKNTAHARAMTKGFRFVEGATGQSSSRPIAGQSENSRKNHGMTLENQVGDDGRIRVGDLVLMNMPIEQRQAQIREAELKSAQRVSGVIKGNGSQREIDKIGGAMHKPFIVPGSIKREEVPITTPTKKSYFVPAQIS
jgi:hypothetical protein